MIEFYKENSELWVTQEITRGQKALKKEDLVEEFGRKFSIEILEKAFHALRASFLREHKKYQKEGKLPNKGWKFYESMLFLKNEPKSVKNSIYMGPQIKCAAEKLQHFLLRVDEKYCLWSLSFSNFRTSHKNILEQK